MTTRHIIEVDTFFLLAIGIAFGALVAVYNAHKPPQRSSFIMPVIGSNQNEAQTATPTPSLPSKVETSSQVSPDGTKTLFMTTTTHTGGSKTYVVSAGSDSQKEQLYTTTLSPSESMSIPFNTWSPDNAYVFLSMSTASGSSALVMRSDGKGFTDSQPFFDIGALFLEKNTGTMYQETTGWASDTLLIINSTSSNGEKGPSYWFEVPSKAIIQLSTLF